MKKKKYDCPCCGAKEVYQEKQMYEFCPVCRWSDDPVNFDDPDFPTGANYMSLNEYRNKWEKGKTAVA
jgi:hypothetical protein